MKPISAVEKIALAQSGFEMIYPPTEKMGVIQVDNFPKLGKLTALRFLEWVQENPEGVISLPTGKTPEFFIKEVRRLLDGWKEKSVQAELAEGGINGSRKPDMRKLRFVQIDDFYPIDPTQHNSFYDYVNRFYIKGFDLDPRRALLINCAKIGLPKGKKLGDVWTEDIVDLSLRYRQTVSRHEDLQKAVLQGVDQWCTEFEERIREMGGIGFFLGGIGPDGHIGFNVSGSDLHCTTRLSPINYETQAAAASDLGGIEVAKQRLVITIGLSTITWNPDCTAIIIAAGEAKAQIVANAIQEKAHIRYPATALHELKNARFYITRGAAKLLEERNVITLGRAAQLEDSDIERVIIDLSLKHRKKIISLVKADFEGDRSGRLLLEKRPESVKSLTTHVRNSLVTKLQRGIVTESNKIFYHTEPHHDDVMLGYLPYVVRHIREHSNRHFFATLTSGFTAVTNNFVMDLLTRLRDWVKTDAFEALFSQGYFEPENTVGRDRDVWQYLDGVAADSRTWRYEGRLRRLVRNLIFLYGVRDEHSLTYKIKELRDYFKQRYPGEKDRDDVQRLKGMCREWEADCVWGYFGWSSESVYHLRLGFYKGDIFTEEPTLERDVPPILETLHKIRPDIISVAFDPEASGPDTHYKVLQATTEALRVYETESGRSDIEVLGYRNVWFRFHPSEADLFVPVSLNMFSLQESAFKESFVSQRDASFPSYEHDGPFSELAQRIQVNQYQMLKICLGREFFYEHDSALIRATRGMVFLKRMNLQEFYQHSRALRRSTENR